MIPLYYRWFYWKAYLAALFLPGAGRKYKRKLISALLQDPEFLQYTKMLFEKAGFRAHFKVLAKNYYNSDKITLILKRLANTSLKGYLQSLINEVNTNG